MYREAFTCKREELTIRGAFFCSNKPETGKKYPAIIYSHGFTGNYGEITPFCEKLCDEGYICVAFNFCGGGCIYDTNEESSDGDSINLSITSEVGDLLSVFEYVSDLPFVNKDDITLFGSSQGGYVSGIVAGILGEKIKNLVMLFPALCIPDHARRGMLGGSSYDPGNVPDEINLGRTTIGKTFHVDVVGRDPFMEIGKYKGPVLLIQGTKDFIVNSSYAIRAKHELGENCELLIVRGMGHGHDKWQADSIAVNIRQFLKGRREVFSFRIIITHSDERTVDGETKRDVYFTGYCESDLFVGTIIPGGVDNQVIDKDGKMNLHAKYTFDGIDSEGMRCSLSVDNKFTDGDYRPVIKTDSSALAWLNSADLYAVVESGEGGPTIRVFK